MQRIGSHTRATSNRSREKAGRSAPSESQRRRIAPQDVEPEERGIAQAEALESADVHRIGKLPDGVIGGFHPLSVAAHFTKAHILIP